MKKSTVEVQVTTTAHIQKVWDYWTKPQHIVNWNFAIPEWHCPKAENELEVGGKFNWRMEAKDGSMGFDYAGVYENIVDLELIEKRLDDGRMVRIEFKDLGDEVMVKETFEIEDENSADLQKQGWQAILGNFKAYAEKD